MSKVEQKNRKSYAMSFASFLIRRLTDIQVSMIRSIILYGSVAKSASTKESDIDIFLDMEKDTKNFRKDVKRTLNEFYSSKEAIIFKLMGIDNDIKLKMGKLDDWKELKRSIISEGIILWRRMESGKPSKTEHKVIFYWDGIRKNRGAFLNKLYGYKTGGKRYEGFLSRTGGAKLGKSSIMIPIRYREKMIEIIKKYKANAKAIEVFIGK